MSEVKPPLNLASYAATQAQRLLPEPRNRVGNFFGQMLKSVAQSILPTDTASSTLNPEYISLINRQIETQQQMQLVSLESNVEKSKHETQMAAIRNVRVG